MLSTRFLAVFPLALLLAGGALFAQDSVEDPNEKLATTPAQSETESAAGQGTDRESIKESADPFDYEASEQISEDLSVSFPVDI